MGVISITGQVGISGKISIKKGGGLFEQWEAYDGTNDGVWTSVMSEAGTSPPAASTFPIWSHPIKNAGHGGTSGDAATVAVIGGFRNQSPFPSSAQLISVSGTTLATVGSKLTNNAFGPGNFTFFQGSASWDDTHFVSMTNNGSLTGQKMTNVKYSGSGITSVAYSAKLRGQGGSAYGDTISSTQAILGVSSASPTIAQDVVIATRSGDAAPTVGARYASPSTQRNTAIQAHALSATRAFVYWQDTAGAPATNKVEMVSISGTTITQQATPITVTTNGNPSPTIALAAVDDFGSADGRCLLIWQDNTSGDLKAVLVRYDGGSAMSKGTEVTFSYTGSKIGSPAYTRSGVVIIGSHSGTQFYFHVIGYNQNDRTDLTLQISSELSATVSITDAGGSMQIGSISQDRFIVVSTRANDTDYEAIIISNGGAI